MVNLLTRGVVFIHTCIISNSSLSLSLSGWNQKARQGKRVKFNSYHQEQLSCSIDSIVHHRLTSLDMVFLFFSCLPVSHGSMHIHADRDHRGENRCQQEKRPQQQQQQQRKDGTTYVQEIILIVTLPSFTPALLSTAYLVSGSGHSTRECDIYIYIYR